MKNAKKQKMLDDNIMYLNLDALINEKFPKVM